MADDGPVRLHALIKGRVQGVGFRYYVEERASFLGITGWVRNLWDSQVEVVAEGPQPALESLLKALQRGPSSAFVSKVETDWETATGEFSGFHIRSTV